MADDKSEREKSYYEEKLEREKKEKANNIAREEEELKRKKEEQKKIEQTEQPKQEKKGFFNSLFQSKKKGYAEPPRKSQESLNEKELFDKTYREAYKPARTSYIEQKAKAKAAKDAQKDRSIAGMFGGIAKGIGNIYSSVPKGHRTTRSILHSKVRDSPRSNLKAFVPRPEPKQNPFNLFSGDQGTHRSQLEAFLPRRNFALGGSQPSIKKGEPPWMADINYLIGKKNKKAS